MSLRYKLCVLLGMLAVENHLFSFAGLPKVELVVRLAPGEVDNLVNKFVSRCQNIVFSAVSFNVENALYYGCIATLFVVLPLAGYYASRLFWNMIEKRCMQA